jgi:hypothetical protein
MMINGATIDGVATWLVDGWVYIGQALERGDLHQMGVLKRWGN